jgi:hypothetical protein
MATDKEKREVEIVINGQKANASLAEMDKALRVLNAQFRELPKNTKEWKDKMQEVTNLKGQINEIKGNLGGVGKGMSGLTTLTSGLGGAFKSAMTAMLPLLTISEAFSFLSASKAAFEESAAATAQLEASLKSTGGAAGITKEEILALSTKLQDKTLFGDEETTGAASLLLTFTNIKKGVFEEALPAIQDIATKMAGDGPADLKGASIQVGKALNDPIKGITALSRVGVSFSEEQKKMIKTLVETGDTAAAQKLILAELNTEFGGSAEAARKAKGGMQDFKVIMDELQETVGEGVQAGLSVLGNFLTELFTKADPLIDVFKGVWTEMSNMFSEVSRLISGLFGLSDQGSITTGIINVLTGVFNLLLTPIKAAFSVIGSLVRGFIDLYNSSETVRATIGALGSVISTVFTTIKDSAIKALGGVAELMVGIFTLDVDKIKSGLSQTFGAVKDTVVGMTKGVVDAAQKGAESGKLNFIPEASVQEASKNADKVIEKVKGTTKNIVQLTEEQLKEQGKKRKEAEDREKKEKEKADALAKKAAEDRLKADEQIAQKRIALMTDEYEQKRAKISAEADKEIANLVGSEEQKKQLIKMIRQQQWTELDALEKAHDDKMSAASIEAERVRLQGIAEVRLSAAEAQLQEAGETYSLDDDLEAMQEKLDAERELKLLDKDLTESEIRDIEADYQQQKDELDKEYSEKKKQRAFDTANQGLQAASQLVGAINNLQQASTNKQIDDADKVKNARIAKLDEELKTGKITKDQYDAEKEKAEDDYNKKVDKLKRDQQKKNKKAAIIQALISTAMAVVSALASPTWPAAIGFAAFAALMGGLQVAAISKQPDSSFAAGGFTATRPKEKFKKWADIIDHYAVGGYTGGVQGSFKDGGWARTRRIGEIGEAGTEYVIPHWQVMDPIGANIVGYLEAARQRKQFADGGFTDAAAPSVPTAGQATNNADNLEIKFDTLISELQGLRQQVSTMGGTFKVVNVLTEVEEGLNELAVIRAQNTIS